MRTARMRKVVYTCIIGDYDILRQPEAIAPDWDFICFSDSLPPGRDGAWDVRPVPFSSPDATVLSRYVKILPHKVLKEYEWSLWIDANILIKGPGLFKAADAAIGSGALVAQVPHPLRDCAYEEIRACAASARMGLREASELRNYLKREGFPEHFGLFENNIMLRRHCDVRVVSISEEWWKGFLSHAHRDQPSLMFVYWKDSFRPSLLFGEGKNSRNVDCVEYQPHSSWNEGWLKRKWKGIRRMFIEKFWK